ncbi:VWFA and cache domain-containing protein 1 [Heterocephalus glaber]|uniref:VWFA and cache domain-containing protein 1 n=1 Tax=Heterocephalus glaber TaxID=10181 RepID=G5BSN4_HETGA|nr:VWFA and cache domain-containing protein 1 [Heterocephalus glaber]
MLDTVPPAAEVARGGEALHGPGTDRSLRQRVTMARAILSLLLSAVYDIYAAQFCCLVLPQPRPRCQCPPRTLSQLPNQLAKKIREKFNRYLDVVSRNKQVVEASYTAHLTSPLTAIQDCCTIPPSMMEPVQSRFGVLSPKCGARTVPVYTLAVLVIVCGRVPVQELRLVLADNLKSNPGIKWQYFSSEEGIFTVFPAHKFRCKGSYEHRSRETQVWMDLIAWRLGSAQAVVADLRELSAPRGKGLLLQGEEPDLSPEPLCELLGPDMRWVYTENPVLGTAPSLPGGPSSSRRQNGREGSTGLQRHGPIYVSTVRPQSKHIVVMLDHGSSVTDTQLQIARDAAQVILRAIDEHDKISVLTVADTVRTCSLDQCYKTFLSPATSETKRKMSTFVGSVKASDSPTQHAAGFQKAFQLTRSTNNNTRFQANTDMVIIYLSAGVTSKDSSEEDKKATLRVINEENSFLNNSVMILTYALMNDGVTGLKELAFLRDLAEQNSGKYGVPDRSALPVTKGSMMVLNQLSNLETTVGRFYTNLPNRMIDEAVFSLPFSDEMGDGLIMTVSKPCYFGNLLLGIVGVDVNLAYILEDVTYYQDSLASYTFLIDDKGYTLMHPSLSRPYLLSEPPLHTDIIHYENIPKFELVRQNILSLPLGSQTISVPVNSSLSWHINKLREAGKEAYNVSYAWKMVQDTSFILCIVVIQPEIPVKQLKNLNTVPSSKLLYHRLDLLGQPSACLHFKQLATLESPTVMLSAGSFSSPYEHLSQPETKRMVEHYTAYLSDNTRLIANPGLKFSVRNEVMATSHVPDEWMAQMEMSSLSTYIVRRYIATPNGVLRIYPGSLMDKAFDPTRRQWYLHAVANPGLISLTGPYLDVGGAGYVVTISHTIHSSSTQLSSGHTVAVMGIDFTLRYFYKVLMDLLPVCNQDGGNKIRCFIMEDRGYLVAHPTLIDPKGHAPVEQQHITHKEPLVANDILNHPNFVKKNLCNSFSDRTVQRFYKFNTSLVGDLTNLVHGSHCSKYRLARIPGTNAFVGIVNETCDSLAFCACSMVDRLCLNCHRMEQNECECPCECPLEVNECTGNLTHAESRNPSCEVHQEPVTYTAIDPSLQDALHQCVNSRCSQRLESGDCFGVLDCEWCVVDSDGKTQLDRSYCAPQKECFGGIVGAKSPYRNDMGAIGDEVITLNMIKSAPVGPVAGGIMGCIMVLVLAVYAYRHQIHRRSHQHMSPLAAQEMSVRMSNLENDRDERDDDSHEDRGIISNTRFIAAVMERHAHSPERRRRYWGRSGTESDHGYSTMSPQEDSENPPCSSDPLSAGVDVGNHDEELDMAAPPQTAALLSHKPHHCRPHHAPLHHSHHLQNPCQRMCWGLTSACAHVLSGRGQSPAGEGAELAYRAPQTEPGLGEDEAGSVQEPARPSTRRGHESQPKSSTGR